MTDLVGPLRHPATGVSLPRSSEDVPHVVLAADEADGRIADEIRLVHRRRKDRPRPLPSEGPAAVSAGRETDRRFDGNGYAPAPARRVCGDRVADTDHVHRKDSVLVKAAQLPERDDRLGRDEEEPIESG